MDGERISRRRAGWQKHFREGLRYDAVVDAERVQKALRGNAVVVIGTVALAAAVAGGLVALAVSGLGRLPTYLLVGLLLLLLLAILRMVLRTRGQLRAGLVSPSIFTVSTDGIRLAGAVDVPWADVTGLVVVDTTGARASGLGGFFGRLAGSPEELLLIGVRNGALKGLSDAAGPRLRPLFWSNWGAEAGGAIRIPLDRLLSDDMRGRQIAGLDGIAPTIPVRFGITSGRDASKHLVKDVLSGAPLPVDEVAVAEARAEAEAEAAAAPAPPALAVPAPVPSVPASAPAPALAAPASVSAAPAPVSAAAAPSAAETLGPRRSVPPPPPTLTFPTAPEASRPPLRSTPPVPRSSSTPPPPPDAPVPPASAADSRMTVRELAALVLSTDGRRRFDDATVALAELGPDAFAERHPDLDEGFSDDGPAPLTILFGVSGRPHPPAVGWCDADGQDEDGQILSLVEDSCRTRGLAVPAWPDALAGETDVVTLFRGADRTLAGVGLRLLFIDDDPDTYHFTPVEAAALAALDGRAGDGFTLRSIDWFGPAPVAVPVVTADEEHPPPQHADTAFYARPFGPVDIVTIRHEGTAVGYLYSGVGSESHRGGVHFHATVTNPVKAPLTALVKDLQSRGIPAAEGFAELYGRVLENGVSLDAEPTRYPTFIAFDRVARAFAYAKRTPGISDERWRRGSSGYGEFVRDHIDAALRGEIRVSEDAAALIADLDTTLLAQPSAEDRTLLIEIDRLLLPDAAGARVFLPSYMRAREESAQAWTAPDRVRVRLHVPAGTGVLAVPAESAHDAPMLVLPRGATILFTSLSDEIAEARLEAAEAAPVTAGAWLGPERMLRDIRADEEYFADLLVYRAQRARGEERRIHDAVPGAAEKDVSIRGRSALHELWKGFTTAYSQGAPFDRLREEFDRLLSTTERVLALLREHPSEQTAGLFRTHKDFYRYWLMLVSLAVAFRVDEETFDHVVAASSFGHGDRLIDRLIASRRPEHPLGDELRFPRIVGRLDRAFTAPDPTRPLEEHLDRWYGLWKGVEGWDGHLLMNRRGYVGYWAFEVLGVVAALDLDDEALRDLEYYPHDLGGLR